jgi:hypothetical protein
VASRPAQPAPRFSGRGAYELESLGAMSAADVLPVAADSTRPPQSNGALLHKISQGSMDDIFIMSGGNDLGLVSQLGTWLRLTELTQHICRLALNL